MKKIKKRIKKNKKNKKNFDESFRSSIRATRIRTINFFAQLFRTDNLFFAFMLSFYYFNLPAFSLKFSHNSSDLITIHVSISQQLFVPLRRREFWNRTSSSNPSIKARLIFSRNDSSGSHLQFRGFRDWGQKRTPFDAFQTLKNFHIRHREKLEKI